MSSVHHRPLKGAGKRRTHHSSMDREPGQLISSIRDDDDSFEVRFMTYIMHNLNHVLKSHPCRTLLSWEKLFFLLLYLICILCFWFQITLDVSEFTPEEITVKTTDRNIVIHGTICLISLFIAYVNKNFHIIPAS